jgi:hypothetical protein
MDGRASLGLCRRDQSAMTMGRLDILECVGSQAIFAADSALTFTRSISSRDLHIVVELV